MPVRMKRKKKDEGEVGTSMSKVEEDVCVCVYTVLPPELYC